MIHNPVMHNSYINYPSILPLCRDHLQYRGKEKYKCDTKTWSPGGRKQALHKKMYFFKKCSFLFWNCKIQMKNLVLESHFNKVTDLRSIALHVFYRATNHCFRIFAFICCFCQPASELTETRCFLFLKHFLSRFSNVINVMKFEPGKHLSETSPDHMEFRGAF